MLDAEEARARLDTMRDGNWQRGARRRLRKVKRAHRHHGALLIDALPERGSPNRLAFERALETAAAALDQMSTAEREALLQALHPGLGATFAHWWIAAQREPYVEGWSRHAFRVPNNPELTRRTRIDALRAMLTVLGPYDRDAVWLAAWAPHLGRERGYSNGFAEGYAGRLLAAAIDAGGSAGQQVYETLEQVGRGEHPVGVMGRHVIVALLRASRPEGWAYVQRLLLAAQRQEGLRQSILEAVDEAHPDAFDLFLETIVEHKLLRFAATVRAVCVWVGLGADVEQLPEINRRVEQLALFRSDLRVAGDAIAAGEPWSSFLALCAVGMRDAVAAIERARIAARHESPNARAAALRFLAATRIPPAIDPLLEALDDPDLTVAALAHRLLAGSPCDLPRDVYDRLERLACRLPDKPRTSPPIGVEQAEIAIDRSVVIATMVRVLGERPLATLIPWVPAMDVSSRWMFVRRAAELRVADPDVRRALVTLLGDRSAQVRNEAVAAIGRSGLTAAEAPEVEALLTRRAGDLRRGVVALLANQREPSALASVERLWNGEEAQRDAACELLAAVGGSSRAAVAMARRMGAAGLTERQLDHMRSLLGPDDAHPAAAPPQGLGLLVRSARAPVRPPSTGRHGVLASGNAAAIASALDDLAESHRDTQITVTTWQASRELLLADVRHLPSPFARWGDQEGQGMVLADVFRPWWYERPPALRGTDGDGMDALGAYVAVTERERMRYVRAYPQRGFEWWVAALDRLVAVDVGELRHRHVVAHVLSWLVVEHASATVVDRCLDALEATLAALPSHVVRSTPRTGESAHGREGEWRGQVNGHPAMPLLHGLLAGRPELFDAPRIARWFALLRWVDEPFDGASRIPVPRPVLLAAHDLGIATDDDVTDSLLIPRTQLLRDFTRHRRSQLDVRHPRIGALADRVRDRVLAIERTRGDLETVASEHCLQLGSVHGAELAVDLLGRLGKAAIVRGWLGWGNTSRESVYSHLLRVSHPAPGDTAEVVRAAAAAAKVADARLVEFAVFAPQWAAMVEAALGWPGLDDAIWWFHAHTKDEHWSVDQELRETWAALSAERTPLNAVDLVAGAVDVEWFARCHRTLGPQRWKVVHRAAKLASGGNGHRRAQLFADAMLGAETEEGLTERIRTKRHQDSVRALGLLPLPGDPSDRAGAVSRRYALLREFERGASKFGSQRQASERGAVRIAIENLARTAGARDPQRFVWTVEAAEAGDLAHGPVTAQEGDVVVTLSVTDDGTPELSVDRGAKRLQSIPAAVRKAPPIVELRDRKTALSRQATRVRSALEQAMVRQDELVADDFAALDRHPVVAPMLASLVLVDADGRTMRRTREGTFDVDGNPVHDMGAVRIAHPVDLLASGTWIRWQERLFADERRQPFKQVFRELYLVTEAERAAGPASRRYEGHQVQPRQAMALFTGRGWLADRESGDVSRVFHDHDLVARVLFVDGFLTPAEVELPTIDAVFFTRRGDHLAQPIEAVPPVVFSETMRDLDLVVSVAHAGGVDPEATASTVEMRAALVTQTAKLLRLDNLRLVGSHVVIEGALGEYSVHLGSGVVHRRPGGSVCIIAVPSQRRGRLFLPFADDDPKTAEIVSKVLLLANDKQIKDPTILEQLRS